MVIWGGDSFPVADDGSPQGAAYEPRNDRWRVLPDAPISVRRAPVSAFTGEEFLVWGGIDPSGTALRDGAAFDPAHDRWRVIAPSPLHGGAGYVASWTGTVWILVEAGTDHDPGSDSGEAAAYDPATDAWQTLPRAPIPPGWASASVWDGSDVLVVRLASPGAQSGVRFNLARDEWSPLPATALLTQETEPTVVWTGTETELIRRPIQTSHGLVDSAATVALDTQGIGEWRRLPGPPDDFHFGLVADAGGRVVLYSANEKAAMVLNPRTGWLRLDGANGANGDGASAVWTGTHVLIWGGSATGDGVPSAGGLSLVVDP
jgi:hypothetical protein